MNSPTDEELQYAEQCENEAEEEARAQQQQYEAEELANAERRLS